MKLQGTDAWEMTGGELWLLASEEAMLPSAWELCIGQPQEDRGIQKGSRFK